MAAVEDEYFGFLDDMLLRDPDVSSYIRARSKLLEQLGTAKDLLQGDMEDLKRGAGVEPKGQVAADAPELSAEGKGKLSQIISVLKELKASQQRYEAVAPPSPEAIADEHLSQGNAYWAAAEYKSALTEYTRALEVQPENATLLNNRGVALGHQGRYEEALAAYDSALKIHPDDPVTLMSRGIALRNLDRHEEALDSYDRALKHRPDDPATLTNRGVALRNLSRHEEALDSHDRALKLRPDDPAALMNRGILFGYLGRYEEALADYNHSLQLRPDYALTFYNRACLYARWQKPDRSIEDLRRAIAGDAKHTDMARTDPNFDNIRDDPRFRELVGEDEPPPEGGGNS